MKEKKLHYLNYTTKNGDIWEAYLLARSVDSARRIAEIMFSDVANAVRVEVEEVSNPETLVVLGHRQIH